MAHSDGQIISLDSMSQFTVLLGSDTAATRMGTVAVTGSANHEVGWIIDFDNHFSGGSFIDEMLYADCYFVSFIGTGSVEYFGLCYDPFASEQDVGFEFNLDDGS